MAANEIEPTWIQPAQVASANVSWALLAMKDQSGEKCIRQD